MRRIVWLASYPKSGNTWARVFLSQLTTPDWRSEDINSIPIRSAASRARFDAIAGVEASDLSVEEICFLLPGVYDQLAAASETPVFLKTHDAWTCNSVSSPILSERATGAAVYITRNPFDVLVSYAHHLGQKLDATLEKMIDTQLLVSRQMKGISDRLPQRYLDWSGHVQSWLEPKPFPVHLMRYEQMKTNTRQVFIEMVRFLGLDSNDQEIDAALEGSRFDRLQALEKKAGFVEKPAEAKAFFREGKVGSWREVLSDTQVRLILDAHGPVMRRLGYLSNTGEILC